MLVSACYIGVAVVHQIRARKDVLRTGEFSLSAYTMPHIFIVIPCLWETKIIEKTIRTFAALIGDDDDINLLLCTTEKEYLHVHEGNEDTVSLVHRLKMQINAELNRTVIQTAHYPRDDGMMAHQLNYVLEMIQKKLHGKEQNTAYFFLYNADSLPHSDTLTRIKQMIVQYDFPPVLQQFASYHGNFSELSCLMKGHCVLQTSLEYQRGYLNHIHASRFFYQYVMGHGLCIRMDTLTQLGGFNTSLWCEDLCLSLELTKRYIHVLPVSAFETATMPIAFTDLVKQHMVWFSTASNVGRLANTLLPKGEKHPWAQAWIIKRRLMNIDWAVGGVVPLVLLIIGIARCPFWQYSVLCGAYLVFISSKVCDFAVQSRMRLGALAWLELILYTVIAHFTLCCGPLYYVIALIRRALFGKVLIKTKTER